MNNKAIWMLAGGPMQEIAAKKIIERGYRLLLTDRDPHCVCSKYADDFVELDTFDIDGNIEAGKGLTKKYDIMAVIPPAADCHETAAHIGKTFNLHAISPEVSRACRYKNITREILTKAAIPQPRYAVADNIEDARTFMRTIETEAVVKATDNSGSRGFSVVKNADEINSEVVNKALDAGTTRQIVIEEKLTPVSDEIAEQSVETLWYNGRMYWLNWVDRLFRKDFLRFKGLENGFYSNIGWGVEIGHINPAIHSYEIKRNVHEMIYKAGIAIGMKKEKGGHILKADIMLTNKGPYIIELTPRLSGGWDSSASTPARGGDFVGGVISLALRDTLNLETWHKYFEYKNPNLFASVMAFIKEGAQDCIGRLFAIGSDFERERAIEKALYNLKEARYVVSME